MDTAVLVALITSFASLAVSFGKVFWDERAKSEETRLAEKTELKRYRTMLLNAADDLGHRIDNIRNEAERQRYTATDDKRALVSLRSTLFRFGQYLTWAQIYRDYLRANPDKETGEVSALLNDIGRTFGTDRFKRDPLDELLMLWREEQSAIADVMRRTNPVPDCVGFRSFMSNFDDEYSQWFRDFEKGLRKDSQRLAVLQGLLAELIRELDHEHARVRYGSNKQLISPSWARSSQFPPVVRKDQKVVMGEQPGPG